MTTKLLPPLDHLCFEILSFWFRKCQEGKGGALVDGVPWVRATAEDMLGYLEHRGATASLGQIRASLKRLEALGLVRREKRFVSRYDHRMWFAPANPETPKATTPEGQAKGDGDSPIPTPEAPPQNSGRTQGDPPINSPWISSSNKESKVSSGGTEGEPVEIDCRRTDDGQPTVSVVMTVPRPTRNLQEILRRCQEHGGNASSRPTPQAPRKVVVDGAVRVVNDGATGPLR